MIDLNFQDTSKSGNCLSPTTSTFQPKFSEIGELSTASETLKVPYGISKTLRNTDILTQQKILCVNSQFGQHNVLWKNQNILTSEGLPNILLPAVIGKGPGTTESIPVIAYNKEPASSKVQQNTQQIVNPFTPNCVPVSIINKSQSNNNIYCFQPNSDNVKPNVHPTGILRGSPGSKKVLVGVHSMIGPTNTIQSESAKNPLSSLLLLIQSTAANTTIHKNTSSVPAYGNKQNSNALSSSSTLENKVITPNVISSNVRNMKNRSFIAAANLPGNANEPYNYFTCEVCGDIIYGLNLFETHKKKHLPKKCPICNKEFPSKYRIAAHIRRHSNDKPYKCDMCDKSFREQWLLKYHKQYHDGNNQYFCKLCNFTCFALGSLKNHEKTHKELHKYKCRDCDAKFSEHWKSRDHGIAEHGHSPHVCKVCNLTFVKYCRMLKHRSYEHRSEDSKNEESAAKPRVHHFQCEMCGKTFNIKKSLVRHIRSHTGEKLYTCDECGKGLSSLASYHTHVRTHTGEKPNMCELCGKTFNRASNLRIHKRIHTGEKPYTCKYCSKSFTQRSTLRVHHRYHSNERPYVCSVCDRGFVTKTLLTAHMKNHALYDNKQ